MKQVLFLLCFAVVLFTPGCGNYNNNFNTLGPVPEPSATKRAFVLNQFGSAVDVVDVQTDKPTVATLGVDPNPDSLFVLSNKKTLVHSSSGSVVLIDNTAESVTGRINNFPGPTESILVTPDALFAYAAVPSLGKISEMDLTKNTVANIPADPAVLPGVRHIAITHNGKTIMAFSDNTNSVTFIDRTNADAVSAPLTGFDRPFTALFSSDDSTAYVLNCGPECGGAQASVAIVNMTTKTITRTVNVRAATVGVTDTTNLYVAGTDVAANVGRVDVMNLSTFAVTPVQNPISDGKHTTMALAANNKIYVGAKACSNSGGECLSVFNTTSGAASILAGNAANLAIGDVTAITPISGRTVVYVVQGGTLVIYDTSTDAPQATQIFITGKISDVKQIDF